MEDQKHPPSSAGAFGCWTALKLEENARHRGHQDVDHGVQLLQGLDHGGAEEHRKEDQALCS